MAVTTSAVPPVAVNTLPAGDPLAALLHPQAATLEVGDRKGRGRDSALIAAYTQAVANGISPERAVATLMANFSASDKMGAATVLTRHMATIARDPARAAEAQAMRGALTAALTPPTEANPTAPARRASQPAPATNRRQQPAAQNPEEQQRAQQQQGGLLGFFGNIFKAIGDFFARLFGGGNRQPQQIEGGQQPLPGNQPQ